VTCPNMGVARRRSERGEGGDTDGWKGEKNVATPAGRNVDFSWVRYTVKIFLSMGQGEKTSRSGET